MQGNDTSEVNARYEEARKCLLSQKGLPKRACPKTGRFVSQGIESYKVCRRQCSFLGKFAISTLGSGPVASMGSRSDRAGEPRCAAREVSSTGSREVRFDPCRAGARHQSALYIALTRHSAKLSKRR